MQLKELYQIGKQSLSENSVQTPGLESYLLLAKSNLIDSMTEVYSQGEKQIDREGINTFNNLLQRRLKWEPAAYIVGEKEFYSRSFKVNPFVLIPRPETELLVDEVLNIISNIDSPKILDIGTGSGCIAVTLAAMCSEASLVASDISEEALMIAKENCDNHQVSGQVKFLKSDLLESIKESLFDVVVSNPPYVSEKEFCVLEAEVRDYEPRGALVAGTDGLLYIEKIISDSKRVLKDGGWCMIEIGQGQNNIVQRLFKKNGYSDISITKDLNGIQRVVRAKWKK
ncbi:MAG: peptide chain release factor N(5)-glutamine methyltransferase [Thermodesulfobacteriota bacterium]